MNKLTTEAFLDLLDENLEKNIKPLPKNLLKRIQVIQAKAEVNKKLDCIVSDSEKVNG